MMFNRLPFLLFLFSLIFAPLAFGAVHTYAYTIAFLSIQIGILLIIVSRIRKPLKDKGSYIILSSLYVPFGFLFFYLILQTIPLPLWLVEAISPFSVVCAQKALPASLAVIDPKISDWVSLAPYRHPVRMGLVRLTSYWLLFFGLLHTISTRKRLHILISVLIGTALFQALYGFVQAYGGGYHIWWFKIMGVKGAITGTFINKNNFAGYMMMVTLLAIGYAAASQPSRRARGKWRERIGMTFEAHSKRFLIIFLSAVMFIGLIFSRSRGGITCFFIALCILGILFLLKKGRRATGGVLFALIVVTSAYAVQIGLDPVIDRFRDLDITENARVRYTEKTLEMANDFWITGIGIGNFQYAYPKYQAAEDRRVFIRYAHNDWAQFLSETGIAGMILLLGALSFFLYRFLRLLRTRSDPFAVYLGLGSIAALASIMLHSFVAFDLHIPANALTLSAILAVGYVAIHLERRRPRDRFLYAYLKKNHAKRYYLFALATAGITCVSGWPAIRHVMAEAYCNTVHNSTLNRDKNPPLEEIKKAAAWDRGNAEYWYKIALERIRIRNADKKFLMSDTGYRIQEKKEMQAGIIESLEEAVRLNPLRAEYHMDLAWEYVHMWTVEPESHRKWLRAADIAMERTAYFAGDVNPYQHLLMGHYWVMRSKTVLPVSEAWWSALAKAGWHYRKNLSLESGVDRKRMRQEIRKNIWLHYPNEAFVKQILE